MRVKVPATGSYVYPDAVVACATEEFEDAEVDTLLNPVVVLGVLYPSTAVFDRTDKFDHYRTIRSLRDYVLVSQDCVRVEHFARQRISQWLLTTHLELDETLELPSIGSRIPLLELYARVEFDPLPSSAAPTT